MKVKCIKDNWSPNLTIGKVYNVISSFNMGSAGKLYFLINDEGALSNYVSSGFEIVKENEYKVDLI